MHVGNGALIDNTYKLCKKHISEDIEILTIDPQTNTGRFPRILEDAFSEYNGSKFNKLKFSLKLLAFYITEAINIKIFKNKLKIWKSSKLSNIKSAIERADICVSLSGETINDYYRPHLYLRLLTYHLAILNKKKFIIFPQSIGPIFRPTTKFLLRRILGKAEIIIARDQASLSLSTEIWKGSGVKVLFSPDVATTQESSPVELPGKREKKTIGLTVSDIPQKEMGFTGDYLPILLNEITKTFSQSDYQFLLMPSNYQRNAKSDDYKKCIEAQEILIKRGYEANILENKIFHPEIYQGMQRNLFAFISTRMHVGILGTSAGVPTLMINTQHKILEYMKLINMSEYVIELTELPLISKKLAKIHEKNLEIRQELQKANQRLQARVNDTLSDAAEYIKSKPAKKA